MCVWKGCVGVGACPAVGVRKPDRIGNGLLGVFDSSCDSPAFYSPAFYNPVLYPAPDFILTNVSRGRALAFFYTNFRGLDIEKRNRKISDTCMLKHFRAARAWGSISSISKRGIYIHML